MTTELEAKWLDIDPDAIRELLGILGGERIHPEILMRRKNFDYPDGRLDKIGAWTRVRDEGSRITMSYKQVKDRTLHGTGEVELIVDDFDKACSFLQDLGLVVKSYQETKRERWKVGDVDVAIDTWPWIPTFVELEAPDERTLQVAAEELGLSMTDAIHGSVVGVYSKYFNVSDAEIDGWPEIVFIETPEHLQARKRT